MMETIPQIRLTLPHVAQLLNYCASYRSYLWQCVTATPERNQALRSMQALQGRLEKIQERGQAETRCPDEDRQMIHWLLSGLTRAYINIPPSERRTRHLGELTAFRRQIGLPVRQTQVL